MIYPFLVRSRVVNEHSTFLSISRCLSTGTCYDFFPPSTFIQHFFKIVLYWCLDLIRHNIGTKLKLNKYIFDISIPFLSSSLPICNFKAMLHIICNNLIHSQSCLHVNTGWIHTCDLIGWLFLGNLLTPVYYQELKVRLAHGLKVWNSHFFFLSYS